MNERIKELADRAEHYAKQQAGSDWEVEVPYSQKVFRQKFAELIIRECADVLAAEMNRLDVLNRVVASQTMDTAQVLIKEHFGVKE